MKIRHIGKHIRGCYAVARVKEGKWDTAWSFATGTEWLKQGRGRTPFVMFGCNCPDCPAKLAVPLRDLLGRYIRF